MRTARARSILSPPSRICSLTAIRLMSGIAPDAPGLQLEQAEIRSAAADIDDQDAPRLGRVPVCPFPQGLGRGVAFQPAVEGRLRLLQEPHAGRETGFRCGVQRQALRGGVERGRRRDGDLLRVERRSRTGRNGCPRRRAERSGSARRRGRARSFAPAEGRPSPRAESARSGRPNGDRATTSPTAPRVQAFPRPCGGRGGRRSIPRFRRASPATRPSSGK